MAMKKTSTTIKKGPSPKPAAKTNVAAKAGTKANGKAKVAAKPAKSARKAAPAAKATKATKAAAPAAKAAKAAAPAAKTAKAKAAPAAKAKAGKRPAAVVHWEIQSKQPEALHDFYSDVFGWKIDANNSMNYGLVSSKGANGGIDGGIGGSPSEDARVLVYASVTSIPATLKRIEELGGKTIMPRSDLGMVVMAIYLDPEGNTMGLIEEM